MIAIQKGPSPDTARLETDAAAVPMPFTNGSKLNRILVIESDDALRNAITGALGVAVHVFGAASGKEALRLLEEYAPTKVILNLQMNDMDGFTLLEKIQTKLPKTRVIITSDSGEYDLVCRVTESGVDEFLEKPYSTKDLFASLDSSADRVDTHLDYWTIANRNREKSRLRRQVSLVYA